MSARISQKEYLEKFEGENKRKQALEHALEVRRFEIELYWKRATYFWTFIAATFAGYGGVRVSSSPDKTDLLVFLSCFGMVFSFGWLCVNKGSKQWQENWENHVNMLEDEVIGPLYKITLKRAPWKNVREHFENLVGPSPFSVSKVNLIISFYVTAMWVFLLLKVLVPTFSVSAKINWEYIILVGFSVSVCIGFWIFGRTDIGDYRSVAEERSAEIEPKESFGRINGKR